MLLLPRHLLKDIAQPWKEDLNVAEMKICNENTLIEELKDVKDGQNIALQDQYHRFVGWVEYKDLMVAIFHSYKKVLAYQKALLSSIHDAVTGVNQEGKVIIWNKASEQFYGYTETEVFQQPITNFFQEEAVILKQVLKKGEPIERKYNQPAANVHVLINATPAIVDGQVVGGVSVERDISDLVRLNEELTTTKAYIHDLENKYEKGKLQDPFAKIKGKSKSILDTISIAKKVSKTDATILISGESGVGKELFAEAIHSASHRAEKPFVAINCGAIPTALFESELFGYEKGTFTGGNKEGKKGKIDLAQGGTLFLDEVGELPLDLQVKLLRVLQEKRFYRLGGNTSIPVDLRIITATNRNLEEMVENGTFREDLYYRLNVISLTIPPLRERQEDIPELLSLFLKEFSMKYGTLVPRISAKVMSMFLQDEWRGNIRQLRNTAERLIILSGEEEIIEPHHLPPMLKKGSKAFLEEGLPPVITIAENPTLSITNSEEEKIRHALQTTYNNKSAAAKLLGISRATLYNKMEKYGLN